MARPSSAMIYYQKAFSNARRCLGEARELGHPSGQQALKLKNPITNEQEQVMSIDHAILWAIEHHLPEWSQGTWRMHRCGYRNLLERMVQAGRLSAQDQEALNEKMNIARGLGRNERKKKTSSRRKKIIQVEHIEKIIELVNQSGNKWGECLIIWLHAAVATGLRPNEWRTAELKEEGGRLILRSENFKHNEHRSYATHREIDLTDLDPETVEHIKSHLSIVKGMMEEKMIESYYRGCSSLLYWCNRKLWPKRKANITLYTGRHQFSANAKADNAVSDKERAAMMGHKTTQTSSERYGKTRSGSKGLTPQIANKDVLDRIQEPEIRQHPKNAPGNGSENRNNR